MNKFPKQLSLVVDMYGCPNRCKHCWIGHYPNIKMKEREDQWIVDYFKPYFESITYYSWLREPDYCDDYMMRWRRDNDISIQNKPERFELASFYRLVRDENYVHFLKSLQTKKVQLTFFGLEEMTDKYVGRKGAFQELLKATEILIENHITPRWQAFINEENKDQVAQLLNLIDELKLKERCQEFEFFVHCGSCDGENEKNYEIRLNKNSLPHELMPYFLNYEENYTEAELYQLLKDSNEGVTYDLDNVLVLNISNQMDVYFNYTHMRPEWKIGNLKEIEIEELIRRIRDKDTKALRKIGNITIADLVKTYGDSSSFKLFEKDDYIQYLVNQYVKEG